MLAVIGIEILQIGQPDGADIGQLAWGDAAINIQFEALVMLAVAHAEQQLIEYPIELQIEIQLAVRVFALGGKIPLLPNQPPAEPQLAGSRAAAGSSKRMPRRVSQLKPPL